MLSKLAYLTLCRSIQLLALLTRGDPAKDLELMVLRHQLSVLRRQVPRPRLEPADRALLAAISRALPRSRWSCFLVKPQTLLRWHRTLRCLRIGFVGTGTVAARLLPVKNNPDSQGWCRKVLGGLTCDNEEWARQVSNL